MVQCSNQFDFLKLVLFFFLTWFALDYKHLFYKITVYNEEQTIYYTIFYSVKIKNLIKNLLSLKCL